MANDMRNVGTEADEMSPQGQGGSAPVRVSGAQAAVSDSGVSANKAAKASSGSTVVVVQKGGNASRRGPVFWVAIAIAVLALVACAFFAYQAATSGPSKGARDSAMTQGQLEGKTSEEIQAELDRIVQDGMFNIAVSSDIEMASGEDEAEVLIENVPGNQYLMQVTITRDDTGEAVYTTGIIEPNYHIQKAKLDVDLPQGDYECTATFRALDPETEEEVGQAAAKTTIHVAS